MYLYLHKTLRHQDDTLQFNSVTTHHSAIPSHLYHRKTISHITWTTHHYSMPLRFITSRHCHIFQHKILPQITPHCYHITTATTHHPTLPSRNATIQFRYDSLPFIAFTFLLARNLIPHYSSFPLQNPTFHYLNSTPQFTSATIHYPALPSQLF